MIILHFVGVRTGSKYLNALVLLSQYEVVNHTLNYLTFLVLKAVKLVIALQKTIVRYRQRLILDLEMDMQFKLLLDGSIVVS